MKISDFCDETKVGGLFDGYILNRYGTYDQPSASNMIPFLQADLTDDEGLSTITLQLNKSLIHKHESLIKKRTWIRIEHFPVQLKRLPYNKGDAPVVIVPDNNTSIQTIPDKKIEVTFFSNVKIAELVQMPSHMEREETVSAIVIQDGGSETTSNNKRIFYMQIADGMNEDDRQNVIIYI